MLLSDKDIRAAIASGRIALDPYDPAMVQPSSVDVRIDRYFRVFENHRYPHIDPAVEQAELTRLVEPDGDEPFILHPGEFVLGSTYEVVSLPDDVSARLEGKALAISTPIPTPSGWTTMGAIRIGDQVFGPDGRPRRVVAATEVMTTRPCFEVEFSDHSVLIADASHQWLTTSKSEREHGRRGSSVRTTAQIAASLRVRNEVNHHVALTAPVDYPQRDLPVDPYVLGVWLGDGTSTKAEITCAPRDDEVLRHIEAAGGRVPEVYRVASAEQRLALLQGLMDSDGYVDVFGRCEFSNMREELSNAVAELAASLGLRPVVRKKRAMLNGIDCGPCFQVKFTPRLPVFRLARKLARLKTDSREHAHRGIVAARPIASVPVRCIEVDAADGMFLAGERYIPTHNSSLGRLGLLTHSTAGFIDAGFSGHVTLELSNVATLPIKLWPGMKIGQLCFFRLTSPAEAPYGSGAEGSRYQGQRGPTPSKSFQNFHRTVI
ncbi:MAG: dCTP deaminase [Actinomycetota bacterium]|nr:dCTP deaminase [Actinomycetota bacterium]